MALSATEGNVHQPDCDGHHGRADDPEAASKSARARSVILVKSMNLIRRMCHGFFAVTSESPILRIAVRSFALVALLGADGMLELPATPASRAGRPEWFDHRLRRHWRK
jgi:hypothetical protein